MKKSRENVLRLKGVLMRDKSQIPDGFTAMLARDIELILMQYMDVAEGTTKCAISISSDGDYEVRLQANASRLKKMPIII